MPSRVVADADDAAGSATIEAYTVMHGRESNPETGLAACLLGDGRRAWASTADAGVAAAMCTGEWVGRTVTLDTEGVLHV
jgi:acetyl-CoA C-acetyltransferase